MAFPTAVNDQIIDSVTQANTKVLGDAPAVATGNFYQATAQALSNAAHNATTGQQQAAITAQAATTQGLVTLYAVDTASAGKATKAIYGNARLAEPSQPTITGHMVIGYIQSILVSPAGKQNITQALEQAHSSTTPPNLEVIGEAQAAIEQAIREAREAGVSDQEICCQLHQVVYDRGVNMLYPALEAPDLTEDQIHAYYSAIIADYEQNGQ